MERGIWKYECNITGLASTWLDAHSQKSRSGGAQLARGRGREVSYQLLYQKTPISLDLFICFTCFFKDEMHGGGREQLQHLGLLPLLLSALPAAAAQAAVPLSSNSRCSSYCYC